MGCKRSILAFAQGCVGAALIFCALVAEMSPARAQPSYQPSLESIKATVDEIEQAVAREDVTSEALAEARQKLNGAADALRAKIEELEPRLHEIEERLKQLGPAPEKDEPAEPPEIAKQRAELTTALAEVEAALKQARVLLVHIDLVSDRSAWAGAWRGSGDVALACALTRAVRGLFGCKIVERIAGLHLFRTPHPVGVPCRIAGAERARGVEFPA